MRVRLPKRRRWRILIYIVSLVLILLAIDMILVQMGRHISVRYETTRITEPRISEGPIDYLAAMENHFSQGVTHENNMVVPLLEALGPAALASNQPKNGITSRLGMPPLPETGDYFQHHDKFPEDPNAGEQEPANDLAPLLERPWKASERPQTAAWLKANEKPLARIVEASKRPRFYYPFNAGYRPETAMEVQLPYLVPSRQAARALIARAMLRIGENGDFSGAREDLAAAHRLGALFTQGATLIDRLVGYSIDSQVSHAEQSLAAGGKLNAAQARQWAAALGGAQGQGGAQLPPLDGFADGIDISERYLYLDVMQFGARRGLTKFMELISQPLKTSAPPRAISHLAPVRWGHAMEVGNVWYDRLTAAASKPDRVERRAALSGMMRELDNYTRGEGTSARMLISSEWPLALFFPSLEKVADREDAAVANRVLARVALALAAHKGEHGVYPATLDALAPAYLAAVPNDPFTNKFLIYRPTQAGYLLYSVGADLKDNGGKAATAANVIDLPADAQQVDIVVAAGDAAITTQPATAPAPATHPAKF
ncbi:MAG: hypothetical protein QOF78_4109 [Phycisphaerales bacterium]|nr:hypothetical protein [Phycisphaerales bacterium]